MAHTEARFVRAKCWYQRGQKQIRRVWIIRTDIPDAEKRHRVRLRFCANELFLRTGTAGTPLAQGETFG